MKLQYAVVFGWADTNYGAYVPELLGCVSVGDTLDEARSMIREAIEFHVEGMQLHGETVEPPKMTLCDAMAFHVDFVNAGDEPPPNTETIFDMVDVHVDIDVELAPAPTAADAAPNTPETAKV